MRKSRHPVRPFVPLVMRVLAIFLVHYGLLQSISLVEFYSDGVQGRPLYLQALYFAWTLMPFIVALLIWLFPVGFASMLDKDVIESEVYVPEGVGVAQIAVSIVGLCYLIYSIPSMIYGAGKVLLPFFDGVKMAEGMEFYWDYAIVVFQVVGGFLLLFFSKKISLIISRE